MQPETLAQEWRERFDSSAGGTRRVGPYYKHQVWRDGRNISRRVPTSEASQLREDIDNAKRYEELTDELARINIEHTRELRATEVSSGEQAESEKNSRPKRVQNASPQPKSLSPKPKRHCDRARRAKARNGLKPVCAKR